jgi:MinD superfamily P-loop ATPase
MGSVSKLLKILKELKIPILGVIENMSMSESPFIRGEICEMDLSYLGSISFDKNLENSIGNTDKILKTNFMKDLSKTTKSIFKLNQ